MNKQEKEVLKILVKKELGAMEEAEEDIEFPSGNFIKSREMYEQVLKSILKELS